MKIAAGLNSAATAADYLVDGQDDTWLLGQSRMIPGQDDTLVRRRDASVEELLWALRELDDEARRGSELHIDRLRGQLDALEHAVGEATYRTQREALCHQRDEVAAQMLATSTRPDLWMCSTRLYRRILKDVNGKLFGR